MKNALEILKGLGVELTEEQSATFTKELAENYKTVAEHDKKVAKLETERDSYKGQFETAREILAKFDGVDVEGIKGELESYKNKAKELEEDFNRKIAERDFDSALNSAMADVRFTSASAKNSVISEIKSKGLKMEEGKILGLDEVIKGIKERDADAFAEEGTTPPKFTDRMKNQSGRTYASKEEILKIKSSAERQKAIAENMDLFT